MKTRLLLLLFPLLGLLAGYLLRKIAAEEAEQGKKYFLFTRQILLFIIMILLVRTTSLSLPILGVFLAGIFCAYVIRLRYLYLGMLAVAAFTMTPEWTLLFLSLMILYGLPFGTQLITKKPCAVLGKYIVLYLLPLLLLLTPFATSSLFPVFVAGTLFLRE
mgnify:CR=1 FL=1